MAQELVRARWLGELSQALEADMRFFVLHGNIDDLYYFNILRGHLRMRSCLIRYFQDHAIVGFYGVSRGLSFAQPAMRERFLGAAGTPGVQSSGIQNRYAQLDQEHAERAASDQGAHFFSRRYHEVLDVMADFTRVVEDGRTSVALVIENAHNLIDPVNPERREMDYVETWQALLHGNPLRSSVIMLTESPGFLHPRIGGRNGRTKTIEICLPDEGERERFINWLDFRYGVMEESDMSAYVRASRGLRLREILQVFSRAAASRRAAKPTELRDFKGINHWDSIDAKKVLEIDGFLKKRIVHQDQAVGAVARAIKRAKSGIASKARPIASFLFIGPTGVGKTELARALALFLFADRDALVRIDMSEYGQKHEASKLIGAPPGYVGHDQGGALTEKVSEKRFCVILLDEMEKAHPSIFNLFLQVLEDGRLTDGKGRTADFTNTVIIMTSNLGQAQAEQASSPDERTMIYEAALKHDFSPEFLNRIDDTVVFNRLTDAACCRIGELILDELRERLQKEKGLRLEYSERVVDLLVTNGTNLEYGARPLRRYLQHSLEGAVADVLLRQAPPPGSTLRIDVADGSLQIEFSTGSRGNGRRTYGHKREQHNEKVQG